MSAFDAYTSTDAVGLAELVRKKEVTPAELVDAAIARMDRLHVGRHILGGARA